MLDFPMQEVTIYHKEDKNQYKRMVKEASFRNTDLLNRNKQGFNSSDKAIIRIFDIKGYNKSIHIKNGSSILDCPLEMFLGETWKVRARRCHCKWKSRR